MAEWLEHSKSTARCILSLPKVLSFRRDYPDSRVVRTNIANPLLTVSYHCQRSCLSGGTTQKTEWLEHSKSTAHCLLPLQKVLSFRRDYPNSRVVRTNIANPLLTVSYHCQRSRLSGGTTPMAEWLEHSKSTARCILSLPKVLSFRRDYPDSRVVRT